jgi:sporulation protein YlmC with PRC-barrel domain
MKKVRTLLLIFSMFVLVPALALSFGQNGDQDQNQEGEQVEQTAEQTVEEVEQAGEEAAEETEQAAEETIQETEQAGEETVQETEQMIEGEEQDDQQAQQQDQQQDGIQMGQQESDYIAGGIVRISKVRDFDLQSTQGDVGGSINDLVITMDGNVPYAVLEFDRQTTEGANTYIVPVQALNFNWQEQRAEINVNPDNIDNLPVLENGELPDTSQQGWDQGYWDFWQDAENVPGYEQAEGTGKQAVLASSLMGYNVTNQNDESLGGIEDIVLNANQGTVEYVALSAGGFLGIGDELLAVPMADFQVNQQEETLVLNISDDEIENIEGFNQDNWPQSGNPNWKQPQQQEQQQ